VQCTYCHDENAYEKDDKKAKQKARQMIRMQMAINKEHFDGHNEITCFSCHRGNHDPQAIPMVTGVVPRPERHDGTASKDLPAVDAILNKYVQALGGAEALEKVTSLVERGTIGDRATPIEYFAKAPNKKMSVRHISSGDGITSFDGSVAWWKNPDTPPQPLDPGNAEMVRLDAAFNLALQMKQVFSQFIVLPPEKIRDREVAVMDALKTGQSRVRLYFDSQSGLLLRFERYLETPLGQMPTQIDYEDYRDAGGVKVPYRWTVGQPASQSFTVQIEQVQQNVPIDDARFAEPPVIAPK
jgi:hypothetical protein